MTTRWQSPLPASRALPQRGHPQQTAIAMPMLPSRPTWWVCGGDTDARHLPIPASSINRKQSKKAVVVMMMSERASDMCDLTQRCDTAGLARRACSGGAGLLRGGELARSRWTPCGCSSRTSRVQRQVWWWISLSQHHHPAQVRCCCEVNSVARAGRTGARRVKSCESGLLVPRMRTCTCVDVRAHARGVLCGL